MNISERDRRISRLIAREIVGKLSETEEQELVDWLAESERNRNLYERLLSTENMLLYQNQRNKIGTSIYWNKVEKVIQPHRINPFKYIGYVAVAATLLFGLIYFWTLQQSEIVDFSVDVIQPSTIMPGTTKATLIFANGEQVNLGNTQHDSLEVNGVKIMSDKVIVGEKKMAQTAILEWDKLIVPRGGEHLIVLSDGTKVHVNSDSRLEFPAKFIGKTREVRLYGEAYFQVTSSTEHPFIVKTENMDIRVTGTEFNVKAYKEDNLVQTTLVRGKVTVAVGEGKQEIRELLPSQQAELNTTDNNLSVRTVDVNSVIAWKNGQFVFKGNKLEEIMSTLSRWYDFKVIYQNDEVRDLIFAGKLNRLENIDSMLEIIESTDKVQVDIKDKTITFGVK